MSDKQDILTVAKKQRHVVLLKMVRDGKALNKSELAELKRYEKRDKDKANDNGLTVRQQAFVDAYSGDIQAAAKATGLNYTYARQLLAKNNKVIQAIKNRQDTEVRPKHIATRQERQQFWSDTMLDDSVEFRDRLRASELLGRSEADFTENLAHTFPKGCGVLMVPGGIEPSEWAKLAAEHYKNGKNGANGKDKMATVAADGTAASVGNGTVVSARLDRG